MDDEELSRWEQALAGLSGEALSAWLREVRGLYREDDAGGSPPDPNLILRAAPGWEVHLTESILTGMAVLMAARIADSHASRAVPLPDAEDVQDAVRTVLPAAGADRANRKAVDAAVNRALTGARASRDEVETVLRVPSYREYISGYLEEVSNRCVRMPDDVFRDVAAQLDEALDLGEDAWTASTRVREYLSMSSEGGFERWDERAQRIARTESTGAYNGSALRAAREESTLYGEEMDKIWVATTDSRTRNTHFRADGQRVPIDAKFRVGRANLDHPGDPRGSAEETVNCRCTVVYVERGEAGPGEEDRQTERERSNGRTRSPEAEVRRRADEGVTRDRDSGT